MGSGDWRHAAIEVATLRQAQAVEVNAARRSARLAHSVARIQEEAAIRQCFAHRFLLAMRETCVVRRAAATEMVRLEQEAALEVARRKAAAETPGAISRTLTPLRQRHSDERRSLHVRHGRARPYRQGPNAPA